MSIGVTSIEAPSVDAQQMQHFRRLADSWWDEQGPFWPLHRLNALRVPFIVEQVSRRLGRDASAATALQGLNILDIGCGGGILSESMARCGATVHGIDVLDRNLAIARDHAEQSGLAVSYQHTSAEQLASTGVQYDVVLNMEVVEHVADLGGFMQACIQLLKPGGVMFVATINRNPLAWLVAIFGAEVVLRWLPRGTHRYDWLRKPKEIQAQLQQGGLLIREMTGVAVNPITRQLSLTGSTAVNYMLSASHSSIAATERS